MRRLLQVFLTGLLMTLSSVQVSHAAQLNGCPYGKLSLKVGETKTIEVLYGNYWGDHCTWHQWNHTNGDYISVTYSSGNLSGQAHITGIYPGTAKVYVDLYVGEEVWTRMECEVTVTGTAPSISISPSSPSLVVGGTQQLTATVNPTDLPQSVTWSVVEGSNIASVSSSGLVTAKAVGTAKIMARSTFNSVLVYKACIVTVTAPATSINLNTTSLNLGMGETAQLTATVLPSEASQSVTWSTSGYSVASVNSSGFVMARGVGTTKIKATSVTNSSVWAECEVTVNPIEPTSISLPESQSVVVGNSITLTPTINPFNATTTLTWSSNAEDVATVSSSGVVNGIKPGTATITVTTSNNKSDSCIITVNSPTTPIQFADSKVKALCVSNWDVDGDGELSEAEAAAVTNLGEVFKGNTEITSFNELQYFSGLKSIGNYAFLDCSGLTSITIPNSVTSIGKSAFLRCSGLTSVTIPNSVTSIGDYAFRECSGLTSIIISNNVTIIQGFAFYDCTSLTSITIPNSVKYIEWCVFGRCSRLSSVTIGNSVTSIGDGAFECCYDLTSVTIPNSVTSIGDGAFEYCYDLTSVTIGNSVTSIDSRAFNGCNRLRSIAIPNSVTSIGGSAFRDCSSLTSITIGNSVTSIGSWAFNGCNRLTSIKMGSETPVNIGEDTFSNRKNATLYVPTGSKTAYANKGYWKEFNKIIEYIEGDVNVDKKVDVVDVVDIARFVVATPAISFVKVLADINNDGSVNIGDAVALVNVIAGDQNFVKGWGAPSGIDANDALSLTGRDGILSLNLDNERSYTAFQFDLYVPEGADVTQMLLNVERKQQHQLLYNKVEDGHFRVTALSLSNNEFNGNDGELLNIALTGADNSEVSIRNIKFFDVQGEEYLFDDIEGAVATSLDSLTPDPSPGRGEIYNLAGQHLNKMQRGINIVGGKKIIRK